MCCVEQEATEDLGPRAPCDSTTFSVVITQLAADARLAVTGYKP